MEVDGGPRYGGLAVQGRGRARKGAAEHMGTRLRRWGIVRAPRPPISRRRPRRGSAGLTLVDLAIAVVVLLVAVGSLSTSIVASIGLGRTNEETARAVDAVRAMVETLEAEEFRNVFARYNSDPEDDPEGVGTGPGEGFQVRGLTPQPGDADGLVGRIVFPIENGPGTSVMLREDAINARLGMPRDLNASGGPFDALDHALDYVILPLSVRVEWRGAAGDQFVQVDLLLVND